MKTLFFSGKAIVENIASFHMMPHCGSTPAAAGGWVAGNEQSTLSLYKFCHTIIVVHIKPGNLVATNGEWTIAKSLVKRYYCCKKKFLRAHPDQLSLHIHVFMQNLLTVRKKSVCCDDKSTTNHWILQLSKKFAAIEKIVFLYI